MKISAIIPAYNNADYIADAIHSILKQTHPVDEIIVIDDGSIDNTEQVVHGLSTDIIYYKQVNQGPSAARNQGIKLAKGDWIAFLDADDQWTPNKIELQLDNLIRFPALKLIAGDMAEIDKAGDVLVESVLAKHHLRQGFQDLEGGPLENAAASLLHKNFIPTGTVLVWREALLVAGLFNENIRFGEDLELWVKIAVRYPITCLPACLMLRKQHGNNTTQMTELMLVDLTKVMQSLKKTVATELTRPHCNINSLLANSYNDLGYWYFCQAHYRQAICAFLSSLKVKITKRAMFYLAASLLPPPLIQRIKAIKSSH